MFRLCPAKQIRNEISVLKSISQGHTNIVTLWGTYPSFPSNLEASLTSLSCADYFEVRSLDSAFSLVDYVY